ncbi:DUF397 domain-containing protein [Spirillospora sp. CA-253888]
MSVGKWRKSSHSEDSIGSACIELASLNTGIGLRDSKNPGQGHITLSRAGLSVILADIKADRYGLLEDV